MSAPTSSFIFKGAFTTDYEELNDLGLREKVQSQVNAILGMRAGRRPTASSYKCSVLYNGNTYAITVYPS
jgi:hypothetical protein